MEVVWVPLFYRFGLLPMRLGREPYPCYTNQEPCHSESHNLMYSWRMVKAGNGASWPEFCRPMWVYHRLPTWVSIPNTPSAGEVQTPTKPYRILCPLSGSHWWFWFGAGDITRAYHVSDLALNLPRGGFTNDYHRGGGTHN